MEGTIVNFRGGRHIKRNSQMIILVKGIDSKEKTAELIGKRVVWTSPAKKELIGKIMPNSTLVLRKATLAGLGISQLPLFCVQDDLKAGSLVKVLPKYKSPETPVYVLYPHAKLVPPTTRAFVRFAAEWFNEAASVF